MSTVTPLDVLDCPMGTATIRDYLIDAIRALYRNPYHRDENGNPLDPTCWRERTHIALAEAGMIEVHQDGLYDGERADALMLAAIAHLGAVTG